MLWVKSFHIIFVVTWFAGLFYLPRLFVYHAMAEDRVSRERFKVMERKLFWGVMTPMMMISGVFFPADQLPAPLVAIAKALPLYHGVQIVRPLIAGGPPPTLWLHVAVLLAYAAAGYVIAIYFARRRFSS